MENYQQTPPQIPPKIEKVTTIGEWLVTIIVVCIPIVNIVMLCMWAFGGNTPPTKANFAKAYLIIMVVWIAICILFFSLFLNAFLSALY